MMKRSKRTRNKAKNESYIGDSKGMKKGRIRKNRNNKIKRIIEVDPELEGQEINRLRIELDHFKLVYETDVHGTSRLKQEFQMNGDLISFLQANKVTSILINSTHDKKHRIDSQHILKPIIKFLHANFTSVSGLPPRKRGQPKSSRTRQWESAYFLIEEISQKIGRKKLNEFLADYYGMDVDSFTREYSRVKNNWKKLLNL